MQISGGLHRFVLALQPGAPQSVPSMNAVLSALQIWELLFLHCRWPVAQAKQLFVFGLQPSVPQSVPLTKPDLSELQSWELLPLHLR